MSASARRPERRAAASLRGRALPPSRPHVTAARAPQRRRRRRMQSRRDFPRIDAARPARGLRAHWVETLDLERFVGHGRRVDRRRDADGVVDVVFRQSVAEHGRLVRAHAGFTVVDGADREAEQLEVRLVGRDLIDALHAQPRGLL